MGTEYYKVIGSFRFKKSREILEKERTDEPGGQERIN